MSTIYTRAGKGSALTWTEGDANITNLNNDKIEDIVEDTTPQLGGNLDVNGNSIVSVSNGNIAITPNGTGSVVIDGNAMPQDYGVADQVLITDGAGQTSWSVVKTVHSLVYNADSVTINKGQPVYLFGANGANPSVKLAANADDATSATTYGLANESIAAGATGEVVTQGLIKNVNTSTYTEGAIVYLGATAGTLTATKPYAPNHLVYLGVVTSVNSNSGRILVKVQNGYELDELHNVQITATPSNGQVLAYESSSSLWKPTTISTGASSLDGLSDVTITGTPSVGQILRYTGSGVFENVAAGYLAAVGGDTNPQLGGNLNVNGNKIVSASNGNIAIEPNGTGIVTANKNIETTGDAKAKELWSTNSTGNEGGQINLATPATGSSLSGGNVVVDINQNQFRIFEMGGTNRGVYIDLGTAATSVGTNLLGGGGLSNVVEDTTPQLGGDLDVQDYKITSTGTTGDITIKAKTVSNNINLDANNLYLGNATTGTSMFITTANNKDLTVETFGGASLILRRSANGNVELSPTGTGKVLLGSLSFPSSDGTSNQVLKTDGAGNLSWTTITSGATNLDELSDVVITAAATNDVLVYNGTNWVDTAANTLTVSAAATATTATNADNINIITTNGNTSDTTTYVALAANLATGNQQLHIDSGLVYNASTNALTATSFAGSLNGSVGATTPAAGTFTTLTANASASLKAVNEGALFDLGTTGGTVAPNVANGNVQKITLNSALTLNAFTSPVAGQSLTLIIYGGTAYTSITSTMKFAGGVKTLTATAGCIDILSVYYDGTNYFASLGKGFA